jgi:hypothetical protein
MLKRIRAGFVLSTQHLALSTVLLLSACIGRGEVVTLDVHALRPPGRAGVDMQDVTVLVSNFEDTRPERCRLGMRTHFWGGQSFYKMEGSKPGEVVPKAMVDYLRAKGWRAETLRAEAVKVRTAGPGEKDVIISGRILDFAIDVQGGFLHTDVSAKARIAVQAVNAVDGSQTRITLRGAGSHRVIWFTDADAEHLMNDVLTETVQKFLVETSLEEKAVRLK